MFRSIYIKLFVFLLAVSVGLALGFVLIYFGYYLSGSVSLVLSVLIFFASIQYSKKGFREVNQFLNALQYGDTTVAPHTTKSPKALKKLFSTIGLIRKDYQKLVFKGKARLSLLNELIEELPVGVIASEKDGTIIFFNREATQLLGTGKISQINRLEKIRPVFYNRTQQILNGGSALFSYQKDGSETKIIVRKLKVSIREEEIEILIFHPIDTEYSRLEMSSWDKLLGILTHEIANSITAISSLSHSALSIVRSEQNAPDDLRTALEGVHRRSDKLLRFVRDYRALAEMPQPKVEAINLRFLIQTMSEEWMLQEPKVIIEINCPGNLTLLADEGQLILCFENFFLNAIHALRESQSPKIKFTAMSLSDNLVEILFRDNGKGMEGDVDRAVVPFFTTRAEGRGLGLAFSRQIIRAHHGTLSVKNTNPGFQVTIKLPLEQ